MIILIFNLLMFQVKLLIININYITIYVCVFICFALLYLLDYNLLVGLLKNYGIDLNKGIFI